MCNVWRKDTGDDLTPEEFISLFKDHPQFFKHLEDLSVSGGEPFLLRELPELLSTISGVCRNLTSITIPTNGLATTLILEGTRKTLEKLRKNIIVNVGVSLDGIGEVHDNIRGVKGAYHRAVNTLTQLKTLQHQYPNLSVGFGTVLLPQNLHQIEELKHLAETMKVAYSFTPSVTTENLYDNTEVEEMKFTNSQKQELIDLLMKHADKSGTGFKNYCAAEILSGHPPPISCPWGYSFMYIDSNGDVYPCHYLPREYLLGNTREQSIEDIWFSEKATQIRKKLKTEPYCAACIRNCGFYENIKTNVWSYLRYKASM
jgi:radical SAM protein with 4Fe4S-binding SPASM domain